MFLNWDGVVNTISVKMKRGKKFTNFMDNDKVMCLLAMKAQCEAKHSVVIESLNHHATMWECMLWCALRSVMVVHHQWFVACLCWGWAALVLVSMIVASTHVLHFKSQIHSPQVLISGSWTPLGGRHDWWLPNPVSSVVIDEEGFQFTDVLMHSLFSFSLWTLVLLNDKPCDMMYCITVMLNEYYLMIW